MELTDSFTVPVTVDRLWAALTDVERIAPCVPGFVLQEANDPEYKGAMKVKVGAITMQYDAVIRFVERDDDAWRVVLSVTGKERRGPGSVNAKVTSSLIDKGQETTAEMVTDVQVTGRVAQFGRGILADVSSRMTAVFVDNLNTQVLSSPQPVPGGNGQAAATAPSTPTPPPPAPTPPPQQDALDLGKVGGAAVLKRVGPLLAGLAALVVLLLRFGRRSR